MEPGNSTRQTFIDTTASEPIQASDRVVGLLEFRPGLTVHGIKHGQATAETLFGRQSTGIDRVIYNDSRVSRFGFYIKTFQGRCWITRHPRCTSDVLRNNEHVPIRRSRGPQMLISAWDTVQIGPITMIATAQSHPTETVSINLPRVTDMPAGHVLSLLELIIYGGFRKAAALSNDPRSTLHSRCMRYSLGKEIAEKIQAGSLLSIAESDGIPEFIMDSRL